MVFISPRRKQGRKVSFKANKRRCITVNSYFTSSETDNLNTAISDNVTGNSNLPHINVHNKSSLNKIITLQKETDTVSSIIINDEITDDNITSE